MLLDLNNAASIVEWWLIYPQRHGPLLADWSRRRPEHRATILEARRRIKADPSTRDALRRSDAGEAVGDGLASSPLSHDELAAGESALTPQQ